MSFTVVNTISLPGVDFGEHLLEPFDVRLISALGRSEQELIDCAAQADAVVCSGPVQPWTARVIRTLTGCRIIASLSIGYDRIDLDSATEQNIVVTNVPDYCIDEVSTHALTLMLALGRKIITMDHIVRKEVTNFVPPNRKSVRNNIHPVFRLQNQVLGIVGLGRIGTSMAMKARGLGMKVIAYDPYVWDAVMLSYGVDPVDFETLLKRADMVSIHCTLTDETRDMFTERTFKQMKPSCYLINTARGEIVVESALIQALASGQIAGAGLDVTRNDPLALDDPIKAAPNVILTGHGGWYSTKADSATEFWHKAMGQVALALQGKWPHYAVNPKVKDQWRNKWGG